ncbi:hypothetical protein [Limnohabitans sp.]|jgi:hypothetical protein|uniref:hypothetical protein n=1 Tax=Limnohabitans sp. TaxID=1907725 RepID=UPI0031FCDB3D
MICLEFIGKTHEASAGRIPTCIEWLKFNDDERAQLLDLFASGFTFKQEPIAALGWIGIDANTGGQLEDEDAELLASMLKEHGINQLLASSQRDLLHPQGDWVLGAKIHEPTDNDIHDLQYGFWCMSDWIDVLEPLNLMWINWCEQFLFTWPLQFALLQLCEGEGHTTIVGPPEFINEFKARSNPAHWYKWEPWGLPLCNK